MNKKRYIPLVIIGALILSLIAVFPAFGAGSASFIMPGDIDDANDGGVDDPSAQDYGRQGGKIGLFVEDDDLDVPIRRVLIPGGDGSGFDLTNDAGSGRAHITAHSSVIYTTADLDVGEYVAVHEYPVRKVTAVVVKTPVAAVADPDADPPVTTSNTSRAATDTGDTENNWYLMIGAGDGNTHTVTSTEVSGIADAVFGGFVVDDEPVTTTVSYKTDSMDEFMDGSPSFLTVAEGTLDNATESVTVAITAGEGITTDDVMKDTVYTLKISVAGTDPTDPTPAKTDTLHIHIYYPTKATLDKPFPMSTIADDDGVVATVGSVFVRETTISTDNMAAVDWSDNYDKYALAILLTASNSPGGTPNRFRLGDKLVANSNIADTDAPDDPSSATPEEFQKNRLTGSTSGLINASDAMVINPTSGNLVTDGVAYISRQGDTIELTTGTVGNYLVAWFEEANSTGGTVKVRSQAYSSNTTLVMMETGPDSGEFALKIEAVPFGDDMDMGKYDEPMVNAMDENGNPLPKLPVYPRDTVTLSSSGSSATLPVETSAPSFTGLSPAHNYAGSETRPTVSGQVTDGDSGLAETQIDVLFRVLEGGIYSNETVNTEDDGDSDAISGGFSVSARLGDDNDEVVPDDDATIYWWIRATDKAGNVGFSDRVLTNDDGTPDACMGQSLKDVDNPQAQLEDMDCQPYVIRLDSTQPTMLRAETGRNWNSSLTTEDSKDKTEYRVTKAVASSVLVVFDEHLDISSVSASDFEVNGSTPADATPQNVTVRNDSEDGDGNPAIAGNPQDIGEARGYVFLHLSSDLNADAEPKVELVGEVLDLAGNEQDTGVDNDATDRIAPTLTVKISEGNRPVTKDKVNLIITSDEVIGSPTIEFVEVTSHSGDAEVTPDSDRGMSTPKFVSSTEYTAVVSAGNYVDGLYTIHVKATDAAGGNIGMKGDMSGAIDVSDDTSAILFEHDEAIGDIDVDPRDGDPEDSFETDDANTYIRIDFSPEGREYDNAMYDHDMDGMHDDDDDPATPDVTNPDATAEIIGDDLDTHAVVTIVSATLNGEDISGALQSNSAGNVFLYKAPEGLAIGDHDLEVIAEDAAGNRHLVAETATITITERKPFSLALNPGWNLVSIPGEPADPDINVVIPADRTDITSVLAYDPSVPGLWLSASRGADGMFSGTLKNITSTRGYWIETNTFNALPVMIPKQSPGQARVLPTIPLAKGWNMVPVLDVDGDFEIDNADTYFAGLQDVRAYTFDTITNRWELKTEVEIGRGYWVYVSSAGIIVP